MLTDAARRLENKLYNGVRATCERYQLLAVSGRDAGSFLQGQLTRDVLALAEVMKARVRERFGVELEEEVMFLGERPSVAAAGPQG